jgi:hypothetical protein
MVRVGFRSRGSANPTDDTGEITKLVGRALPRDLNPGQI